MSIDRAWVSEKLLGDAGFRIEYLHTIEIHVGPLSRHAYRDRRIAMEVGQSVTQWGNTAELLARICSSVVGLWFYAGWVDQAVLHVGRVERGGPDLISTMLSQFDDDRVDQGGDMLVGFMPTEKDWLLAIQVSPDDDRFIVSAYTDSDDHLIHVRTVLGLSG